MILNEMEIDDFNTLSFCAFRYALGRKSYIVRTVVDALIDHKSVLDPCTKDKISAEIVAAIDSGKAGMDMDVKDWNRCLEELSK